MQRQRVVYMKVTRDEYELPVAVADTVVELAKICGVKVNSISKQLWCSKHTTKSDRCIYVKVEIDD